MFTVNTSDERTTLQFNKHIQESQRRIIFFLHCKQNKRVEGIKIYAENHSLYNGIERGKGIINIAIINVATEIFAKTGPKGLYKGSTSMWLYIMSLKLNSHTHLSS